MKKMVTVLKKTLPLLCLVCTLSGCLYIIEATVPGAETVIAVGSAVGEIGGAVVAVPVATASELAKNHAEVMELVRIGKGSYTVSFFDSRDRLRKNTVNSFVQSLGYDSYDSEMKNKGGYKKLWVYSVTMPGSVSVVMNDKFGYKRADTACTAVTATTFGTDDSINSISYVDGKFIVWGNKGKGAYSSDGITWTAITDKAFGSDSITNIVQGGGKFVGRDYSGKMVYSLDGVNWTAIADTTFGRDGIYGIVYGITSEGRGIFVVWGNKGKMAYSSDGITWTTIKKTTFGRDDIRGIVYGITSEGRGIFVARGFDGKMAYSSDSITWTAVKTTTFGKNPIDNLIYRDSKFVAVGRYSGKIAYSLDGVNWTATASTFAPLFGGTENNVINGITYGDGKFVIWGNTGKMAYSVDGITWMTIAYSTFGNSAINNVAYGNGKFVAVGENGKIAYWDGK